MSRLPEIAPSTAGKDEPDARLQDDGAGLAVEVKDTIRSC
jgi:hypothetical protein